jgi:hypothetical protein
MAEYANDGARTRFVGSDPGFVGFKSTFTVFDAVSRTPACVILLDEIDRAHSSIQDVLLSMLEGSARDGSGALHRFSQVVFIMTTNLGQEFVESSFASRFPIAEGGSPDDDARAAFGDSLPLADLRDILVHRRTPQLDSAALHTLLQARKSAIERDLHSLSAVPGDPSFEPAFDQAVHSHSLISSAIAQAEQLSGRNALDRAFLDRIDFIFPFLPLEKRHLAGILSAAISAEPAAAERVAPGYCERILNEAAAAGESGRGIARRWGELAGQLVGADLTFH